MKWPVAICLGSTAMGVTSMSYQWQRARIDGRGLDTEAEKKHVAYIGKLTTALKVIANTPPIDVSHVTLQGIDSPAHAGLFFM